MKRTRGKNDRESRLARVPAPKIALAILLAIYSDIFFGQYLIASVQPCGEGCAGCGRLRLALRQGSRSE